MKASEFIGMKVLNHEAMEVGKIADLTMNTKECVVNKIIIAEGGALKKKFLPVTENDLAGIGDFVQLKIGKEEMDKIPIVDKIEDLMENEIHFKDFVGKTVISEDAIGVGKIENIIIDTEGCLIHELLISTGKAFDKKHLMISDADIKHIGDYVLLRITKEGLQKKIVD